MHFVSLSDVSRECHPVKHCVFVRSRRAFTYTQETRALSPPRYHADHADKEALLDHRQGIPSDDGSDE